MIRVLDSAGSTLVEWGRQQQQQQHDFQNQFNRFICRREILSEMLRIGVIIKVIATTGKVREIFILTKYVCACLCSMEFNHDVVC